jgi:hypothetical protein
MPVQISAAGRKVKDEPADRCPPTAIRPSPFADETTAKAAKNAKTGGNQSQITQMAQTT